MDLAQLEAELLRGGPLGEVLPPGCVMPEYHGGCIANLPATIGDLLGQPRGWVGPTLGENQWRPLSDGVDRVILLLVDGVGWRRMWQVITEQGDPFAARLQEWGATVAPLTSISPCTTSAATTTLWGNGALPAEHGMLGYTFLLAQQSAVGNMLFWRPAGQAPSAVGTLAQGWGLEPERFLPTPSIAQVLAERGIGTTALMPQGIQHSPLSRMQMRGAKVEGYQNATMLWLRLREWLQDAPRKSYCYAYYSDFDTLSHIHGPDELWWGALWAEWRWHLERFMADAPPASRRNTLFLITADHGHVTCPPNKQHTTGGHPEFAHHLTVMPGGEPRHSYLYARHGHLDALKQYHAEHLAQDFHLLDAQAMLHAGLYGPANLLHPDAERRVGDLVLLSKGGATFWVQEDGPAPEVWGMHGSLEPEEMIVPFIALRLDA